MAVSCYLLSDMEQTAKYGLKLEERFILFCLKVKSPVVCRAGIEMETDWPGDHYDDGVTGVA